MAIILHTVIVVALIVAAVVLTALGHDGTPAWAALGGYAGGAGVQAAAPK